MKKLLTALATAATAALGFAEITAREDFEDSSYTAYDNDTPSQPAAYPFDDYGDYYRSLDDDGDEELLADDASCVDAVMQFKYADVPDEFDEDVKLVVFANSDGKLVVVDANATNVTTTAIAEDTWYRLTIVSVDETVNDATVKKFKVYVNGASVATEGGTDSFTSRVANSNSVAKMTLSGTGKVDNFVARTTDPFGSAPAGWIANIGTADPEQYFTDYTKALEKALAGATLTFADGVTEMDGTAEHPFEIRTAADLVALQQAVATTPAARAYNYVQTANIDMADADAFTGIGTYNKSPTGGIAFTGVYDGGSHKISNVTMTARDYGGIFNQVVGGTIKNLTVEDINVADGATGEYGYAIVGHAANGATLQNLTAAGSFLSSETPATHNAAGIVVRACGGATAETVTTIANCTNNAAIYGAYTKLAGVCAIAQTQTGFTAGSVLFQNCSNTGALDISYVNAKEDATGFAGILAYSADDAVLEGCSNTGTLTNSGETENDNVKGALVGNVPTKKLTLKSAIASGDIGKFNAGCTVALDFNVSGNNVDFNLYGATGTTVELLQDFTGYPPQNAVINPTLKLSANMTISNGWSDQTNATFTAISGTGTLTVSHPYNYVKYYRIKNLDGFTGTLASGKPQVYFVIDDIVAAETPAYGTAVVKGGSSLKVYDLASTKVNGAAASLVVDTVDNQNGIYLAAAEVVADDGSTTAYVSVEKAFAAADAAKATSITVYDGSSDEVEGWAYENGVYSRCIAKVGETSYTTLAAAIAAANEGETKTVELLYTCGESVTIPAGVTVNSLTTANDFHGTLDGAGTLYYAMTPSAAPTATDDFTGEVVIGYNWSSNADLKWYGGSNSTITVTSFTGNNTYFPATEKILSKVRVAEGGTVAINNGWNISLNNFAWTADRVVEIPALKVDGTFSLAYGQTKWNDDSYGAFYVKSLDASGAGSITVGNRFALRIDAVDFAEAPGTDALVAMTLAGTGDTAGLLYGPNGVAGEKIPVTVNGEATEQTLVYDAVKGGLVLYVAPDVASMTVNGVTTGYKTLQEALNAITLRQQRVVLLANETEGAVVPAGTYSFYIVPGVFTYGTVSFPEGDYVTSVVETTVKEDEGSSDMIPAVYYTCTPADIIVVAGGVRSLYFMSDANDAIVAATAGGAGSTVKFVAGGSSYQSFMEGAGFTYDSENDIYTLTAIPVAAVYTGVVFNGNYTTLAEAVAAANGGDTVKLLADVAVTETQTISKSVTLDLNGKNVTATDCRAFHVTAGTVAFIGTGTISTVVTQGTKLASSSSVIRVGSNTAETNFTLGENVTVTSDYCYGITYFGTMKQTVVINGTVTVTGVQAAISGNGLASYNTAAGGSDVTVNGMVSATQDYAIYNPQTGTTAITGTVTGGIEVKAGTVTVAGTATVTARNVTPSHSSNQNGTSTVGYAIASVGNSSYKQPAKVSVAAGATVTGSVIILKENNSETYGEITSAANTLTIPAGYVWNGPADGVYTLAVASGFDGGDGSATFSIDSDVQATIATVLPSGKTLESEVLRDPADATSGTGMTYAQAYALGLLDLDSGAVKDLKSSISFDADGNIVVSLADSPREAYAVTLKVYTKSSLSAEWPAEATATYEYGSETAFAKSGAAGFYKVEVVISGK